MEYKILTKFQKIAILIGTLNNDSFNNLLKPIPAPILRDILLELRKLKFVPHSIVNLVLEEFKDILEEKENYLFSDFVKYEYLNTVIQNMDNIKGIIPVFIQQSPQIQAVIFAKATMDIKKSLLASLPIDKQAQCVMRSAKLREIPKETVDELLVLLEKNVLEMGAIKQNKVNNDVNELLKALSPAERERILNQVGDKIEVKLTDISKLLELTSKELQKVFLKFPRKTLLVALRPQNPEILDHLKNTMTQNQFEQLVEDINAIGPQKQSLVDKAQAELVLFIQEGQ